ncbi:MAG: flagellar hook protein FlgE [Nitrospirae bacterium]|nr:MAG: flagellar hook protein FlgE [Nitrospirota bacterium]
MMTALYTAISGLNANGVSLSVIGDNVANMNTVGFKASRVAFGDVLSQLITGIAGSSQIGRGVMVTEVAPLFTQGSFETTSSALDLAIDGNGFFIVQKNGARFYTRAGQFSIDRDGYIVTPDGLVLQGYQVDSSGNITGSIGDLQIATQQIPANMTTQVEVAMNLDPTVTGHDPATFTLDGDGDGIADDPVNYDFTTQVTVYDSQGDAHAVTLYFIKDINNPNQWVVHYVYDDPANPGQLLDAGTQTLVFGTNGELVNDNSATTTVNFNWGGGVLAPQSIVFNYGTGTGESPPGTGLDQSTQFAGEFAVLKLSQDGYPAGSLKNLNISEDGTILGIFTNGQTRTIGRVALAKFAAPTELVKMGRNLYAESYASGQPIIGAASTGGLGRVLSNTLELSNVDLAEEFVKMITAQRGFQANSKIITTTDSLLQELVNLKR